MPRFAAIGLDHRHIYKFTQGLLAADAICVGHDPVTSDPRVLAGFRKLFPDVPAIDRARLLADPSIDFVVIAAIPRDRADLAERAMRAGKHVLVDKPGAISRGDLDRMRRAVVETGKTWSVALGRHLSGSIQAALRVARSGEIGRLVHLTHLAPHRLNRDLRPAWFFDKPAYGGIITDIGIHSVDQFLAFAGVADAHIDHAAIGVYGTEPDGFEDFAEFSLSSPGLRGYARVDWFTPDGLDSWGDGRLFVVGTDGTIELRKNFDPLGRAGGDHMFVVNRETTRHADCSAEPITYYAEFLRAIAGDPTALDQTQAFAACDLTLRLQARALRFVARRGA